MLDIGWSELLVVAIVAIVVVGPKDLPRMMRTFGQYARKLRRAARDFQHQFEEAMAEGEAEEVRKNIENIKSGLGSLDTNAPPDRPLMTPTPSSIEQALPPAADPKPAPARKVPARKSATQQKKAAPKRKTANKTAAKTARKPTTAKRKTKTKTKTRRKS